MDELNAIDILRERLKEYKDLLEICYLYIKEDTPKTITRDSLVEKLEDHGIGDTEQRPIIKKD